MVSKERVEEIRRIHASGSKLAFDDLIDVFKYFDQQQAEIDRTNNMFIDACASLAAIDVIIGMNNDGVADPGETIEAVEMLVNIIKTPQQKKL